MVVGAEPCVATVSAGDSHLDPTCVRTWAIRVEQVVDRTAPAEEPSAGGPAYEACRTRRLKSGRGATLLVSTEGPPRVQLVNS